MQNKLSQRLKELRSLAGYNQDYVASFLHIARQTYSNYEKGERAIKAEILYKLAGLYNIPVEDLMHLCIELDDTEYYDAPAHTDSSETLKDFLDFLDKPENKKKCQFLSNTEKELLYYFDRISDRDKQDILDFIKIKAKR